MGTLADIRTMYLEGRLDKSTYIGKMYELHSRLFDYSDYIGETDIEAIEIRKGSVIMTFRDSGIRFLCAANDRRLAPIDVLNFGSYEKSELAMQLAMMEPHGAILDIGANFGWYAMHVARQFPDARIFSFEPVPGTFQYLKKNLDLNRIDNVEPFNFGLSENPGIQSLFFDPALSVNASLANLTGARQMNEVNCRFETMTSFCLERDICPDFIKCDVEGAELLVFRGGMPVIERCKPVIFTEMLRKWAAPFGYHPNDIIGLLRGVGYECFTIRMEALVPVLAIDDQTSETNFFFLHPGKHKLLVEQFSGKGMEP